MKLLAGLVAALICLSFANAQTVTVDQSGANTGTLQNALQFGNSRVVRNPRGYTETITTGEGIASKRNVGGNQYGLDFFTSNALRVSITSSGRVGIGSKQPTRLLEMHSRGNVELGLQSDDGNGRLWTIQSSGVTNGPLDANFQIIDRTADLSRLQIDSSGTVSVGILRITGGADLAEPFHTSDTEIAPGSVVVIDEDHPGQLRRSATAYDRRVAGVISGAGGVQSALILSQFASVGQDQNVALTGRVYVLADATGAPIHPGDPLTTSATPGHCMKAMDYGQARGAILGKAMGSLDTGRGLVLALVSLQ